MSKPVKLLIFIYKFKQKKRLKLNPAKIEPIPNFFYQHSDHVRRPTKNQTGLFTYKLEFIDHVKYFICTI